MYVCVCVCVRRSFVCIQFSWRTNLNVTAYSFRRHIESIKVKCERWRVFCLGAIIRCGCRPTDICGAQHIRERSHTLADNYSIRYVFAGRSEIKNHSIKRKNEVKMREIAWNQRCLWRTTRHVQWGPLRLWVRALVYVCMSILSWQKHLKVWS